MPIFIFPLPGNSPTNTAKYQTFRKKDVNVLFCDEDIDVENIGGTLKAARSTAKEGITMSDSSLKHQEGNLSGSPIHHKARLLLHEDD